MVSILKTIHDYPLATQLAQRLIVGFHDGVPDTWVQHWLAKGLGGLILFRDNVSAWQQTTGVAEAMDGLWQTARPFHEATGLVPIMAIDQEGGHIERLTPPTFPHGINPWALGAWLARDPQPALAFAQQYYHTLASTLASLGFNLNCVPTLDVHLQPTNPVIGIRAYHTDPSLVTQLASVCLEAHQEAGVLTSGKHVPGHGSSMLDSHTHALSLTLQPAEEATFRAAITAGCPTFMVNHAQYPGLQPTPQPASLSPYIAQGLLREQWGFTGLLLSDDMAMAGVDANTQQDTSAPQLSPEQQMAHTLLDALNAGMDMLLVRDSARLLVASGGWETLVAQAEKPVSAGGLDREQHHLSLERIAAYKAGLTPYPHTTSPAQLSTTQVAECSNTWVRSVWQGLQNPTVPKPNTQNGRLWVIPNLDTIPQYAPDWAPEGFTNVLQKRLQTSHPQDIVIPYAVLGDSATTLNPTVLNALPTNITGALVITYHPDRFSEQSVIATHLIPALLAQGLSPDSIHLLHGHLPPTSPCWEGLAVPTGLCPSLRTPVWDMLFNS